MENELFDILRSEGWAVCRTAGSGTKRDADCDLITGRKGKIYALEAKSTKKESIYISKDQIKRFKSFCDELGVEPIVAARFPRESWRFYREHMLSETGKSFKVTKDDIYCSFEEIFK